MGIEKKRIRMGKKKLLIIFAYIQITENMTSDFDPSGTLA
jgi:hypothetical protein